jgi:DNA mismatch repair protein MutL
VRDLFFNTPARRRFLKRDATETAHALDAVIRQGLARPEAAFRAVADGKVAVDFPLTRAVKTEADAEDARRERIRRAFGERAEQDLTSFRAAESGVSLEGFAGSPETAEPGPSGLHLFVNGRFVQDRGAVRVARDATKDFFGFRQPLLFVFVSLDPSLVDVNVHPAKLEVRFREPGLVYGAIHRALRGVYETSRPAASPESLLDRAAAQAPATVKPAQRAEWVREAPAPTLFSAAGAAPVLRAGRYLRAFETFLVVESEEGLDLVDQHALHERVNYEELRARVLAGDPPRQGLLVPEIVEVSRADAALAEENAELWASMGLDVLPAGPTSLAVRGVPAGLKRTAVKPLVSDLLDLARRGAAPSADRAREEMLHRCACHASVKAGDSLTDAEIEGLLERAARLPADQTCPHGRPTRIRLTLRDLERAFERT